MDLFNSKALESARLDHVILRNQISMLLAETVLLKNESGIARDIIDRYVAPELEASARKYYEERFIEPILENRHEAKIAKA